ncbi:MAG: hypothetical protein IPG78_15040 [Ignavibacteria bacterium]|nr:hypothetical protein [Ignavibacteria bacterium]
MTEEETINDPTSSTPDNITHCQLRYNTFTSSLRSARRFASTGASSTFEFTISRRAGITNFTSLLNYMLQQTAQFIQKKKATAGNLEKAFI